MTIALGEPTRIPENRAFTHPWGSQDFSLGSACTVDPTFDIVIPAYWSAEATTVGFDTPISMRALITRVGSTTQDYSGDGVPPTDSDNRVLVEQNFSAGASCSSFSSTNNFGYGGSNGFSHQWNEPVPAGSVRTGPLFIIVKDYFSPATPNGDFDLLYWIVLKPLSGGDFDDQAMLYADTNGGFMGIYSEQGITLTGRVLNP